MHNLPLTHQESDMEILSDFLILLVQSLAIGILSLLVLKILEAYDPF